MSDPSATPLSNSDFRRLLATPRSERNAPAATSGAFLGAPSATPRAGGGGGRGIGGGGDARRKGGRDGEDHKGGRGGKHGKPGKPGKPILNEEEDKDEPKYRDRADERRKGANPDYEGSDKMASLLSADVAYDRLSIDETKFLGGDVEHTHLVKGLDYALLQKERMKLQDGDDLAGDAAAKPADGTVGQEGAAGAAPANVKTAAKTAAAVPRREDLEMRQDACSGGVALQGGCLVSRPRAVTLIVGHGTVVAIIPMGGGGEKLAAGCKEHYDFEIEDNLDTDIPTTLRRSKADCPPAQEAVFAGIDATMLERIAKILSYIKTSAGGKKIRKKDRQEILDILHGGAPPTPAAAGKSVVAGKTPTAMSGPRSTALATSATVVDEDDDIFGGAGRDYVPAVPEKRAKASSAAADINGAVDMELEEGEAVPPPPPPPPPPGGDYNNGYGANNIYGPAPGQYGGTGYMDPEQYEAYVQQQIAYQAANDPEYQALLARQQGGDTSSMGTPQVARSGFGYETSRAGSALKHGGDESKWRARPKGKEEREVDAYEDAYGECYPMQAAFDGAVGEDEEDMTQMDDKGKPGQSRYDFTTEEEWQRYKDTREQAPKAVFQFGVKAADGRKSHKGLKEQAAGNLDRKKDNKLDLQLRNIERVMKEKGHDHASAFATPARTPGRGGSGGGFGSGLGGGGGGGKDSEDAPVAARPKKQRI